MYDKNFYKCDVTGSRSQLPLLQTVTSSRTPSPLERDITLNFSTLWTAPDVILSSSHAKKLVSFFTRILFSTE